MDLFGVILDKYGIKAVIVVYLIKTLYDVLRGTTNKYIKAINDNTTAIQKLGRDLTIAFTNIREIREKNQMGPIVKPMNFDQ